MAKTKTSSALHHTATAKSLFLTLLGAVQLIAFWSYYVQFPGLLSSSGVDPVLRRFSFAASWLHAHSVNWIDEDSLCEIMALIGMMLSAMIFSGVCQHALMFAANTALYSVLVRTGGTFYSFQWDMLLLETTFVTCLTYAPWISLLPTKFTYTSPVPLRFLLFKLMFMSGIVKLQAHCPTWEQLTALEYHFATQCLPGPLAWYFHQLPPLVLRLGVAATLWIEIPATVLLVVPLQTARRIGAILQVALQVLIMLTGNYNFFNLLTMALCFPVWESSPCGDIPLWPRLQTILLSLFTFASMSSMFWVERMGQDDHWNINLRNDTVWARPEMYLPWIPYCTVMTVLTLPFSSKTMKFPSRFLHALLCVVIIGSVAVPLDQIYPERTQFQSSFSSVVSQYTRPYGIINGYGLFRRMTGVGQNPEGIKGWAGLPPSIVARPEIILEGAYRSVNATSENDLVWEELDVFRWKPHSVYSMPRQVAPHQPRLDWQMWFAALGSIERNPWLVNFVRKLLSGCEPVLNMVGANQHGKSLQKVRAKLYHYDFTRLSTSWTRKIPGVEIVNITTNGKSSLSWSRSFAREYLPAISEKDLSGFLDSRGYVNFCRDPWRPCHHLREKCQWCEALHSIRNSKVYSIIPLVASVMWLGKMNAFFVNTRGKTKLRNVQARNIDLKKKNQ